MGGEGKVVSGYIHGCLLIDREFTSSVKDAATSTRCAIHLKESDSDLNRLPALTVYLLWVTPAYLIIIIIEEHLDDFLILRKVELVQVRSLLRNCQRYPG